MHIPPKCQTLVFLQQNSFLYSYSFYVFTYFSTSVTNQMGTIRLKLAVEKLTLNNLGFYSLKVSSSSLCMVIIGLRFYQESLMRQALVDVKAC